MLVDIVVCLLIAGIFISLLWGTDRHLCLKDVENDLRVHLSDVQFLRDASEPPLRVHFDAQVFALRTLFRKHFRL